MPNSCDIRLEFGVGGAVPLDDGSGRFYSESDCGAKSELVTFGPSDYTLDDGLSSCKYNLYLNRDNNESNFETRDSQFKVQVPCNSAPAKFYIKGIDDAGTVSTFDGEKFCFGVEVCGQAFYFKVIPCVRNEHGLILEYGSLVFQGSEQPDGSDDSGNLILGYDSENDTYIRNTVLTSGEVSQNSISAYDGECGQIEIPPNPSPVLPPWCSDLDSLENFDLRLFFDVGGKDFVEGRGYVIDNLCGPCSPEPTCHYVQFAGLSYQTAQKGKSLVRSIFDLSFNGDESTYFNNNERFLSNQCKGIGAGFVSFNSADDLKICRYIGKDVCFKIKLWEDSNVNEDQFLGFYLKGGKPCDSGKVDFNNFGHLYFCGVNVEPEDSLGQEFFDVTIENDNFVISNHKEIEFEFIPGNGNTSSLEFGCKNDSGIDCIESNLGAVEQSFVDFDFELKNGNHVVFNTDISEESDYSFESDDLGLDPAEVNIKCNLISDDEQIASYCGSDVCFKFYLFGSNDFLSFYLKGGQKGKNSNVCQDNFGVLYYCGKNVAPSVNGSPVFNTSFATGRVVYSEHLKISEFINVVSDDQKLDFSCDPFSGDDTDKFDLESCEFCISDINVDCQDENFTSDVNEFSSIKIPDTYVNPDTGFEERLPWNGLMWVSKVLISSAKVFYVLVFEIFCRSSNLFKEIANKFIDLGNNFNNILQKSLFYNNMGISEILYRAMFKEITLNDVPVPVSTLNSIDESINDFKKEQIEVLKDSEYDLNLIVDAINDLEFKVDAGSGSIPIVNVGSDTILYQIKQSLDSIKENLKCDNDSLACIIKSKSFDVTIPPSEVVNDIIIESNNWAYCSKAKYDFTDD